MPVETYDKSGCFGKIEVDGEALQAIRHGELLAFESGDNVELALDKTTHTISISVPSIPSEDIEGLITSEQIESVKTEKLEGLITSEQIESVKTEKLEGLITSEQIESVKTEKLEGLITSEQIESVKTEKLEGLITSEQIESVKTEKLEGLITSEQIESVSVEKIVNGTLDPEKFNASFSCLTPNAKCIGTAIPQNFGAGVNRFPFIVSISNAETAVVWITINARKNGASSREIYITLNGAKVHTVMADVLGGGQGDSFTSFWFGALTGAAADIQLVMESDGDVIVDNYSMMVHWYGRRA